MGKNKLEKFADMASYPHVFEYPYSAVDNVPFDMKGNWHQQFFKNDNPIVLELGCGRGEYTVGLEPLISTAIKFLSGNIRPSPTVYSPRPQPSSSTIG